jgi:hypothetical protein
VPCDKRSDCGLHILELSASSLHDFNRITAIQSIHEWFIREVWHSSDQQRQTVSK